MSGDILIDRRKYKRYRVDGDAYTENGGMSGLIIDVGLGGLSFKYVDRKFWPGESFTLDIVYGEDEAFRLSDLPYRVISDSETKSSIACETMVVKRRSVAFDELTQAQVFKLRTFIATKTITDS